LRKSYSNLPQRQNGAALVVGLIMLVILTLLALTGTNTARTELVMAQNEQYRKNASLAASAGIERAISELGLVPAVAGADPVISDPVVLSAATAAQFRTESRFVGEEANLPQSSTNKFIGLHYEIDSTGNTTVRDAEERQRQGVMVVAASSSAAGEQSFGQVGTGLP
jgi:type IV pilus assembly protein PilX